MSLPQGEETCSLLNTPDNFTTLSDSSLPVASTTGKTFTFGEGDILPSIFEEADSFDCC